jgi:hypothetical protein
MITEDDEDVFRKHNQAQSLAINSPQRRAHRYRLLLLRLLLLVVVRMFVGKDGGGWLRRVTEMIGLGRYPLNGGSLRLAG